MNPFGVVAGIGIERLRRAAAQRLANGFREVRDVWAWAPPRHRGQDQVRVTVAYDAQLWKTLVGRSLKRLAALARRLTT